MTKEIEKIFIAFLTSPHFARHKKKAYADGRTLSDEEKENNRMYGLLESAARRYKEGTLSDTGAISAMLRAGFVRVVRVAHDKKLKQ